jgi:hypothetical protein
MESETKGKTIYLWGKIQKVSFLAVVSVLFVFSAAQATIFWSNPTGNADFFDW